MRSTGTVFGFIDRCAKLYINALIVVKVKKYPVLNRCADYIILKDPILYI
jgi:hypothetical protein